MAVPVGIVLAGRSNRGALAESAPDVAWEALIPLAGRPMGAYVVAALAGVREVCGVVVVGPAELGRGTPTVVAPGGDLLGSLRAGLEAARAFAPQDAEYLVATGDAPLLTSAAVADVLSRCRARGLALGYTAVPRVVCEQRFGRIRRTYVRLREGAFTGGNCFYLRAEAAEAVLNLTARAYAARKRPWALARWLGWGLVAGLVLGTVRLSDAERAASRLLGKPAGVVVSDEAGVGVDVDDAGDLAFCRQALEHPAGGR